MIRKANKALLTVSDAHLLAVNLFLAKNQKPVSITDPLTVNQQCKLAPSIVRKRAIGTGGPKP